MPWCMDSRIFTAEKAFIYSGSVRGDRRWRKPTAGLFSPLWRSEEGTGQTQQTHTVEIGNSTLRSLLRQMYSYWTTLFSCSKCAGLLNPQKGTSGLLFYSSRNIGLPAICHTWCSQTPCCTAEVCLNSAWVKEPIALWGSPFVIKTEPVFGFMFS